MAIYLANFIIRFFFPNKKCFVAIKPSCVDTNTGVKQKKSATRPTQNAEINLEELALKMTVAQRHLFANKLSRLHEMNEYSQGTEGFDEFALRIAEMLQDVDKFKELYPYLKKVGYM